MQLAYQDAAPAPAAPSRTVIPWAVAGSDDRQSRNGLSGVGLAVALSVGAHFLALTVWQTPDLAVSGGATMAAGPTSGPPVVVDLGRLAPPPPDATPRPESRQDARTPIAPAPTESAISVHDRAAPPPEAPPRPPKAEATSPAPVTAPSPAPKPAQSRPVEPAAPRAPQAAPANPAAPSEASSQTSSSAPDRSTGAVSPSASASSHAVSRPGSMQAAVPVVRSPRFLSRPAPPTYPPRAVQLGLEGTAIVRALVGGAGTPQEVRLMRSSGYDMLDAAALDAVRSWRFAAAVGAPRAWVELPVRFRLD